ncbi:MAG TPA: hypothetical protein VLK25_13055 [Allosphingosinicella sp.]|nr:hypothetical protein [Allosphingosinicella sp.]
MTYAIAAILMLYALLCLVWPRHVFAAFQGGFARTVSAGYVRGSAIAIRLLGLALLIGVPALFILGYAK